MTSKSRGWALFALSLLVTGRAEALPAFARRTGMGCPVCHDAWPRLNDYGELFRDRGYRTGPADNNGWAQLLDYFPISFRANVGYQYSSTTHQATDAGNQTIGTGGFEFPQADIYFGAALSHHFSVYVDVAGFGKAGVASLESAWARVNDVGTNWVNLKLGVLELDLPLSAHRGYTLFAPFLIYGYHPSASVNGFNLGDNQLGFEVMGHAEGPGLRYSLALTSSGDVASAAALSAPTVYGHVTYTALFRSYLVPRIRAGLSGDIGFWPTTFAMRTPMGGMPAPVAGSGTDQKMHAHAGADLQIVWGELARPITLTAVWMYGQENGALIKGGVRDARFHGGFVQLDYTPILPLTFGARYDGVYNLQQADPTQPDNTNQRESATVFIRYALLLATWGSVIVHTEASTGNTDNAALPPGTPVRNTLVFGGFDFVL